MIKFLQGQNPRIIKFRDQILNDLYLQGLNTYKKPRKYKTCFRCCLYFLYSASLLHWRMPLLWLALYEADKIILSWFAAKRARARRGFAADLKRYERPIVWSWKTKIFNIIYRKLIQFYRGPDKKWRKLLFSHHVLFHHFYNYAFQIWLILCYI